MELKTLDPNLDMQLVLSEQDVDDVYNLPEDELKQKLHEQGRQLATENPNVKPRVLLELARATQLPNPEMDITGMDGAFEVYSAFKKTRKQIKEGKA